MLSSHATKLPGYPYGSALPYATDHAGRPVLLISHLAEHTHNVEAEIFERHARVCAGIRRLLWKDQSRKMRKFEGQILQCFDAVIAELRATMRGNRRCTTLRNKGSS